MLRGFMMPRVFVQFTESDDSSRSWVPGQPPSPDSPFSDEAKGEKRPTQFNLQKDVKSRCVLPFAQTVTSNQLPCFVEVLPVDLSSTGCIVGKILPSFYVGVTAKAVRCDDPISLLKSIVCYVLLRT